MAKAKQGRTTLKKQRPVSDVRPMPLEPERGFQLDADRVIQKLKAQLAEVSFQATLQEVAAEQFRDRAQQLQAELEDARRTIDELTQGEEEEDAEEEGSTPEEA